MAVRISDSIAGPPDAKALRPTEFPELGASLHDELRLLRRRVGSIWRGSAYAVESLADAVCFVGVVPRRIAAASACTSASRQLLDIDEHYAQLRRLLGPATVKTSGPQIPPGRATTAAGRAFQGLQPHVGWVISAIRCLRAPAAMASESCASASEGASCPRCSADTARYGLGLMAMLELAGLVFSVAAPLFSTDLTDEDASARSTCGSP